MLSGCAESGKTLAALEKVDSFCWKYPNLRALMVRKTYKSIKESALITYKRKVLGGWNPDSKTFDSSRSPVKELGGESPTKYIYPNNSQIIIGGLDNADKIMSAEYDVIYINQAEELTIEDYEKLTTRCTGRAGNMPYAQIIGDCNPTHPNHWILQRHKVGSLTLFESSHRDNPVLYDPETGEITEQGKRSIGLLDKLTGARKERLRYGRWVSVEGAIYPGWKSSVHIIDSFDIPKDWQRICSIDFGYSHPFVCQWWAIDDDGRMYMYREIYMTSRTVREHAKQINELSEGEEIESYVADHDREDRATLEESAIYSVPAQKAVSTGLEAVRERLKIAGDGKPRLYIMRDTLVELDINLSTNKRPTCTIDEIGNYRYGRMKDGAATEKPVKEDDDGMDAMRYAVAHVDNRAVLDLSTGVIPVSEMLNDETDLESCSVSNAGWEY